jgi:predicted acylesterase/phospholipase RssA
MLDVGGIGSHRHELRSLTRAPQPGMAEFLPPTDRLDLQPSGGSAVGQSLGKLSDAVMRGVQRWSNRLEKLSKFMDETPMTAAVQTVLPTVALGMLSAVMPDRALASVESLAPRLVAKLVSKGLEKADLEKNFGIDLQDAVAAVQLLNEQLTPVRENGACRPSPLMRKLAEADTPGFVHLGPGREQDAQYLSSLIGGMKEAPGAVPPTVKPELVPVYQHLALQVQKGEFASYIDLDGNLGEMTGTEKLACEQAASIMDGGRQALREAMAEMEAGSYDLPAMLAGCDPGTLGKLNNIKGLLRYENDPRQNGLFWQVSSRHLESVREELGTLRAQPSRFADVVVSLDLDKVVGTQSYWTRLLRSSDAEMREALLGEVAQAWAQLSFGVEEDPPATIRLLDPDTDEVVARPYHRDRMLTQVIDHTLCGLSVHDRPKFLGQLRGSLEAQAPTLASLEQERCHDALMHWLDHAERRYGDAQFAPQSKDPSRVYAASEFFDKREVPFVDAQREVVGRRFGPAEGEPVMHVTLQLEGGGGKGLCYPGCLEALEDQLASSPVPVQLDGFVGTSAGALTALVLAAGFKGSELLGVMNELDTLKFNADFLSLQSARDPRVRGIDRTGLFSMQEMEKRIRKVLADKLDIHDRPITFKDLPFNLSLTSTVQATNLPADDPLRKLIQDGRIEFSRKNTPDFDVVGCALGSAAFPLFFQSPFLSIQRGEETSWMQLLDGGMISNMPLSHDSAPEETMLLMLRANPAVGEVRLKTLAFDAPGIEVVNAANREHYEETLGGQLGALFARAHEELGVSHTMIALNLATEHEQRLPVLQGSTRGRTLDVVKMARGLGMHVLGGSEGAEVVNSTQLTPVTGGRKLLTNVGLDGKGSENQLALGMNLRYGLSAHYRVLGKPTATMDGVVGAAAAATIVAGDHFPSRRFENARVW